MVTDLILILFGLNFFITDCKGVAPIVSSSRSESNNICDEFLPAFEIDISIDLPIIV